MLPEFYLVLSPTLSANSKAVDEEIESQLKFNRIYLFGLSNQEKSLKENKEHNFHNLKKDTEIHYVI